MTMGSRRKHMAAKRPSYHLGLRAGKQVGAYSKVCAVGHTTSTFSWPGVRLESTGAEP